MSEGVDEVKRLQSCISDLISVLALPAVWSGRASPDILGTLLEALVGILRLDFAYARTGDASNGSPIEIVRMAQRRASPTPAQDFGRALEGAWTTSGPLRPFAAPTPLGGNPLRIAPLRFGLRDDIGVLAAASSREDFPTDSEMLLLRVAANQAAIGLQEARLLGKQRKAAGELERRVAERTAQLTAVNEELRKEIEERWQAEERRRKTEHELAAELAAMTRLHELSTRLLARLDLPSLLEDVLDATIALQRADFGNVQLHNPVTRALEIVAQRGLPREFLDYFGSVREESAARGRAMQQRERVVIEDVELDPGFAPHRKIAAFTGFRAVQSTPLFSRSGELLGTISTHFRRPHRPSEHELRFTDLYARQAAEMIERQRTQEEQRKLASLVEHSTDFIGFASPEGQVLFLNRAGRGLVGLGRGDPLREADLLEFVAEPDRERVQQQVLPAVVRDGHWEGEVRLRHLGTGAAIPMLQHVFAIRERGSDRCLALATIARDIRERRQAEDALRRSQEELARVTRVTAMGELTASIAHEVNQPLAAIVTNASACLRWLARPDPDLHEAAGAVERIIQDGLRASEVIVRIRAFVKRGASRAATLRMEDIVWEVINLVQGEARAHDVSVRVQAAPDLPSVAGDPVQLQQVVLNLVLNGIEAMSAVTERPRILELGVDHFGADALLVVVRDCGAGLDGEHERIFDAFYTTKPEGMGMGLAISRSIVEAHGGRLWATPNPGKGTTFRFVLPVTTDEAVAR